MKPWIFVVALILPSLAFAEVLNAKMQDRLKFRFEPYDAASGYSCKHEMENEFGVDWMVKCVDPEFGSVKNYRVHMKFSRIKREVEPRTSYELLYWVTELSMDPVVVNNGPSMWFHMKNPTDWHSLSIGQNIENGTAGLYLEILPPEQLAVRGAPNFH